MLLAVIGGVDADLHVVPAGLAGHGRGRRWGHLTLAAAAGITVYWPVVCLAAVVAARGAAGWQLGDETAYWIVLPLIAAWGAWVLWRLAHLW